MSTTLILSIVAVSLITTSAARLVSAGFCESQQAARLRRRRATDLKSLRKSARVARLTSELGNATAKENTWRVMEVAEVVQESDDCKSYYLIDPYKQRLPSFYAGQYLMVRPAMAGEFQTTRCYSLSSSPNSAYWRITVKLQPQDEASGGRPRRNRGLSEWLHREIESGDCLLIGGPSGSFYLDPENEEPLVLLAAGIGITPMISMLRWSLENMPQRRVELHFQAKNPQHWPLGPTAHNWQDVFPHINVTTYMSRADQDEIDQLQTLFPGNFKKGRMSLADISGLPDAHYFMCGPESWMQTTREELVKKGTSENNVHWESFGGTGNQPQEVAKGDVDPIEVRFDQSDTKGLWCSSEQSLWELAREAGVEIPSGCLSGVCGSCRVRFRDGEIEHNREVNLELASNECLSCVARPKSPVTIEA